MRLRLALPIALLLTFTVGCRGESIDMAPAYTADPTRGARLFRANCTVSCHPADAFARPRVKSYEELALTVRRYYAPLAGDPDLYTPQDVFDITSYLNRTYYHFDQRLEGRTSP